jgi:hypothetical protein
MIAITLMINASRKLRRKIFLSCFNFFEVIIISFIV